MVLPPRTDQGTSPYQGLVMPFNYRSKYHKLHFIVNKALFPNYCLNFFNNMIYIFKIYLWAFITIINLQKVQS